MHKTLALCCALTVLLSATPAQAVKERAYTLPVGQSTVLQNDPERAVAPAQAYARHEILPGESPVTGLPWAGDYLPLLVQISNSSGKTAVGGRTVKAAGVGKRAPWGVGYADIVYEALLSKGGETRFTMLFSDCFAQGQPAAGVGPVRSTRNGQLLLCAEWQAAFVYGGGYFGPSGWPDARTAARYTETGVFTQGVLLNVRQESLWAYSTRIKGKKAPDNNNVEIIGLRGQIADTFVSQPRPFLFVDQSPYASGYAAAETIHLDWGKADWISHFVYRESDGGYLRFCGVGVKESQWAAFLAPATAEGQQEENETPMVFANVIVQRVAYGLADEITLLPLMQSIGQGNADIFIGGRYIPGTWVRASETEPTVFYDDHGRELRLSRGKTFIAQFPPESLCAFTAGAGS